MWEVVDSTVHWEGYSTVRVDTIVLPDGSTSQREVVQHQSAVAVVPVTADEEVILVRQYRHAFATDLLEVPAGGVDPDDDDARAAGERELAEEVHRRAGHMHHLGVFRNSVGWSTEETSLWLATDLHTVAPPEGFVPTGEEADMEVVVLPLTAAVTAATDGTISDAKTILGLLLANRHLSGA